MHPDGIIDFGDLAESWAVGELAVTLSCVLQHPGGAPAAVLPGIRAFHAIRPLSIAEAEALWPLLVLRTAVLIVSGAHQAGFDPTTTTSPNRLTASGRCSSAPPRCRSRS